jgi:hypothetical protein
MSLHDAGKRIEQSSICRFVDFLTSLGEEDNATLLSWVEQRRTAGWMARAINGDPDTMNVSDKTLKRHLDGLCTCPDAVPLKGAYSAAE